MSEIERAAIEKAIKGFEHEIRSLKNSAAREYNRPKQERKIERETLAISLLRAELERENNPLTWSGRINQMTVEEKATLFQHDDCFIYKLTGTAYCDRHLGCEECTKQFLNSPYTEGETK